MGRQGGKILGHRGPLGHFSDRPRATPAQAWPDFSVAQTHSGPCTDAFRQDPCVRLTWQLFSVFSGNVQETLIHFFLNS